VRIEVRDESSFRASSATTKTTAKAKNPKNKKQGNTLEFHSRLIEAAEGTVPSAQRVLPEPVLPLNKPNKILWPLESA
jgi:hypothetical protein